MGEIALEEPTSGGLSFNMVGVLRHACVRIFLLYLAMQLGVSFGFVFAADDPLSSRDMVDPTSLFATVQVALQTPTSLISMLLCLVVAVFSAYKAKNHQWTFVISATAFFLLAYMVRQLSATSNYGS